MEWVSAGGTLILIDREPSSDLSATTSQWNISVTPEVIPELYVVDASDLKQMTADKACAQTGTAVEFCRRRECSPTVSLCVLDRSRAL
jgi:hypothetical protein